MRAAAAHKGSAAPDAARPHHPQALLREVVVDVGRFHGQVAGRVEGVTFVLRGLVGRLAHRQEVCKSGSMSPTRKTESDW